MANIITAPESGIYFDGNTAGVSNFPVLTGDASGVAIQYDGYAGIKINSAATGVNYQDRFSVEGANGRLFGVSDAVTGTVFSVNDAAGLPIIEVESTADYDKITIGEYGTDALVISGSSVEIGGETAATRDWVTGQGYVTASSEQQNLDNVLAKGNTSTRSMSVGAITGSNLTVGDSHFIGNQSTFDNLLLLSSAGENVVVSAANDIYLNTGGSSASSVGTTRLYISSSDGNVGVGTTSPDSTLHVQGPILVQVNAFDQNSSEDSTTNPSTTTPEFMRIGHPGTYSDGRYTHEWVKLDRVGNLPLYLRQSKGTANSFENIARFGEHSYSTHRFQVFGSIAAAGATITGDILLGDYNKISGVTTDNLVIGVDKNNTSGGSSIDFQLDGSTSALFINNSRNVGIGDTTPSYKLDVNGTLRAAGAAYFNGSVEIGSSLNMTDGDISNAYNVYGNYFRQRAHGIPRSNLGDPTVAEMALFDSQFTCKTDLSNSYDDLSDLTFWVQATSSDEWTEVTTYSDDQKRKFLRTNNSSVIIPNLSYKYRVEFNARYYTYANALYMYWSSNSHNTQVHVWKYNVLNDAWTQHTSSSSTPSAWPGHLWLPFSTIPWHETNTTSSSHYKKVRIEFTPNWQTSNPTYSDRDINLYGGQIWGGYPTGRRTPHYYDQNGLLNTWGAFSISTIAAATSDLDKFLVSDSGTVKYRTGAQVKSDIGLGSAENTALSTWAGSTNITTLGTIGTGTWQGSVIASAYLDADTAHLSGTQTFSGAKTFSSGTTLARPVLVNGAHDNGGKADFAVDGGTQISLYDGQVQMGGSDMNWNAKFYYDSTYGTHIGAWDNNITIFSTGTNSGTAAARDIIFKPQISGTAAATERMRIKGNGNVGIGTTTPAYKLDVDGEIKVSGIIFTNQLRAVSDSGNRIVLHDGSGNIEFRANGGAERMTITYGGDVGIGDSSPSYKLDVAGTLRATDDANFNSNVTIGGNLTVNGTTTTINSTTISVDDKNIELGSVASPTDTTADGGGITLKGATDKTINWVNSTDAWTFSERIAIPDGTAAAPALTFTGDTDTGIFTDADDVLRITTGGSWRALFNSSGITSSSNVYTATSGQFRNYAGVWKATTGTTGNGFQFISADATAVTISSIGRINASEHIMAASNVYANGADGFVFGTTTAEGEKVYRSGNDIRLHAGGSDVLTVDGDSSRVGIGTTTPSKTLEVNGELKTANNITCDGTTIFGGTSSLDINLFAAGSLTLKTNNTAALTVNSSQKVGIGTTTSLDSSLNIADYNSSNVQVTRIANDVTTVYRYATQADAVLEWTCGSYFHSEVVITASQTNSGTYNNLYIRGIWSNNHTSHHWDELEHIGGLTGSTFTITNGQNGATTNSGRLTLTFDYTSGSFATLNVRITDFYGSHSYTIS